MKLIVTADDFGMGYETSRGIVAAHLHGPVTCTSLMTVTGDHAARSIPLLADAPKLEIGLHLVMSGTDTPLVATRSSGLLTREGTFRPLPKLILAAMTGRLHFDACVAEIIAQLDRFHALMGRWPAYIDGHHHSHQLPTIRQALARVLADRPHVPAISRATREPDRIRRQVTGAKVRRLVARCIGKGGHRYFNDEGITTNDWFFGMLEAEQLHQPMPWEHYLNHLPSSGTVEWVVHPGCDDPTLVGRDSYLGERVQELNALTNPANHPLWRRPGVNLITKSALLN